MEHPEQMEVSAWQAWRWRSSRFVSEWRCNRPYESALLVTEIFWNSQLFGRLSFRHNNTSRTSFRSYGTDFKSQISKRCHRCLSIHNLINILKLPNCDSSVTPRTALPATNSLVSKDLSLFHNTVAREIWDKVYRYISRVNMGKNDYGKLSR